MSAVAVPHRRNDNELEKSMERLRKLSLFSLAKRRPKRDLTDYFS